MLNKVVRNLCLGLVLLFIVFVGCFSIVPAFGDFKKNFFSDSEAMQYPGFTKKSLESHAFQKYTEALFDKNLRLRKKLISLNNQLYYVLFKKSFAENSTLIIGKNKQIYELHYILDHCRPRKELTGLAEWADHIAELNQYITKQGKTFLYIITPSKAEHMPDTIPDRFHCKKTGIKQEVYEMDKLLTERKVPHINGPDLMVNAMNQYKTDVFPVGGIHWNWLGSTVEAAAIVDEIIVRTKFPLPQIKFTYTMEKPRANDTDKDILALARLWDRTFQYKVPQVHFENPVYTGKPIVLSVIGGSFHWSLNKILLKNKIFSEINYYFYFNKHDRVTEHDQKLSWDTKIDVKDILKSDVIILEENSALLVSEHGKQFYEKMMKKDA